MAASAGERGRGREAEGEKLIIEKRANLKNKNRRAKGKRARKEERDEWRTERQTERGFFSPLTCC